MMRGRSVNRYFSIIDGPFSWLDLSSPAGEIAAGDGNREAGRSQYRQQSGHLVIEPIARSGSIDSGRQAAFAELEASLAGVRVGHVLSVIGPVPVCSWRQK